MDRFLRVWGLRSLVVIAFVLAVPVSHALAQGAPAGVAVQAAAPAAQEEPADPDLGPSNEAVGPEEAAASSETDSDEQSPPPTDFREPREDGT